MGILTPLLAGTPILVYLASMWEADRKRLLIHGGMALALFAYIVISSGFELRDERLFFAGLSGAWLFGVICHALGLWSRSKRWSLGVWRLPEIVGGVIVAVPLGLTLTGHLAFGSA